MKAAIIGTREPDANQIGAVKLCAKYLSSLGITVRTGAADGIDQVAMANTDPAQLEVYLPWDSYNRHAVPKGARVVVYNPEIHPDWLQSVKDAHPKFDRLTPGAIRLHARNYGIILHESPVDLVLAMPNIMGMGGTAQGIRLAARYHIPTMSYRRGTGRKPEAILEDLKGLLAKFHLETTDTAGT